jgi:hypothetical protein
MKTLLVMIALGMSSALAGSAVAAEETPLPAPPQDQGLPYTRSARAAGLEQIGNTTALFVGSRYAYAGGYRVRLDDTHWLDEAVQQEGRVYVPVAFAPVIASRTVSADPAPDYLADRWVHTLRRGELSLPASVGRLEIDGRAYVSVEDLAKHLGLGLASHDRLVLIARDGPNPPTLPSGVKRDVVVTLFDTPEKFADPDLATKYIPRLARQGKWTDHVKVTPEQLAMLHGPETKWPLTPTSAYDERGIDKTLFGSAVPPPGVYPRVLFSEQDLPAIAARIRGSSLGMKSLLERQFLLGRTFLDPSTSDGQLFAALASGDLDAAAAALASHKAGIYSSHVDYVPEALTNIALQCLLDGDDARGREVARAIATLYRLREPSVDQHNAVSDSEWGSQYVNRDGKTVDPQGNGSSTTWRGMHGQVANMNLGLALDFGGKWMSEDDRAFMQRLIAKATYGRRAYGQDGPIRFADVNWVGWDFPNYLALVAIEGLPGCDPEALASNERWIRAYLDFAIDPAGVVFESNGKSGGSFQSLLLVMTARARRGDNLFAHPNLRRLAEGQAQMTSPSGRVIMNSGTQYTAHSRDHLSMQFLLGMRGFYPENRVLDYLLTNQAAGAATSGPVDGRRGFTPEPIDPQVYLKDVAATPRLRLPSPTYSGFVRGMLWDKDYEPATRADLDLPLDFATPVQGVFSAYSDRTPDAAWLAMMTRPNHYLGAGHHHADAGMFFFSALGVDWITESPFSQAYSGKYHNQVLVDGISQADAAAGGGTSYQAASDGFATRLGSDGSFASAELTNSYSWRWQTQPPAIWPAENPGWEMDPSPQVARMFAGTARYKMRPWWPSPNWGNYIATARAPFNPMQYVFRTVGLVRGQKPYAVVVDGLRKDEQPRLYQWTAMLNGGVWQADVKDLPPGQLVLGYRELAKPRDALSGESLPTITPQPGEPLLLVVAASPAASGDESLPLVRVSREQGMLDRQQRPQFYDRLEINHRGVEARYRVLLVPFRFGDPLPQVRTDPASGDVTVRIAEQVDTLRFALDGGRSRVTVSRGDATLAQSP